MVCTCTLGCLRPWDGVPRRRACQQVWSCGNAGRSAAGQRRLAGRNLSASPAGCMPSLCTTLHAELASQSQVHDVLGMRLNRITLHDNEAAPALPGAAAAKKSYEVDDGACGFAVFLRWHFGALALNSALTLDLKSPCLCLPRHALNFPRHSCHAAAQATSSGAATGGSPSPRLRSRWRWS